MLIYPTLQCLDTRTPSFQAEIDPLMKKALSMKLRLNYLLGHHYTPEDEQKISSNSHISPAAKPAIYNTYLSHNLLPRDHFHEQYQPNKLDYGDEQFWEKNKVKLLNPYFSPLAAERVELLPQTYLLTCHVDMLRDDGFLYAHKLREAGVPVNHVNLRHCFHGIINLLMFKDANDMVNDVVTFIRSNL